MPIPTPKPNEAESSFMSRCIRFVINEGTPQEQAIAICASQYRKEKLKVMTWKTIDRKRASYIKYAKTEFSRALKAQANEYLDQVKQSGISAEYTISQAPIENAMYNVYSRVMRQFAQDTYSQMNRKAKKTEINWEEWVSRWFTNNTTDLIGGIDNYTQEGIRAVAERAIVEGWGIREFQNNLFDLYQISERRAELIGRTEIIRASNAGSLMGAQETGIPMMKYWLATRDNRTRGLNPKDVFDHYSMDEDKGIPLDQAFNVSGEQLQHPGDRAGSPGNTINCRCTLTYQVVDEIPEEFEAETPIEEPIVQTPAQEGEFTSYNPVDAKYQENDFYNAFLVWNKNAKAQGEYRTWDNRERMSPDTPTRQGEIAGLQGFKGKPSVISDSEFQKLLDDDDYTIIYRGLTDTETLSADELIRQYKYGDAFDGVGVYGDGTYFAGRNSRILPDKGDEKVRTALLYAENKNENVIAGAFRKKDFNIGRNSDLYELQRQLDRDLGVDGKIRKQLKKKYNFTTDRIADMPEEARRELSLLYDLAYDANIADFATMMGYDGMYIPTGVGRVASGGFERVDLDFYIIFNRTKLFINNKNGY